MNYPNIRAEFHVGKIVVPKTNSKFSAMAISQCREQENGAVKVAYAQESWQTLKWQYRL